MLVAHLAISIAFCAGVSCGFGMRISAHLNDAKISEARSILAGPFQAVECCPVVVCTDLASRCASGKGAHPIRRSRNR